MIRVIPWRGAGRNPGGAFGWINTWTRVRRWSDSIQLTQFYVGHIVIIQEEQIYFQSCDFTRALRALSLARAHKAGNSYSTRLKRSLVGLHTVPLSSCKPSRATSQCSSAAVLTQHFTTPLTVSSSSEKYDGAKEDRIRRKMVSERVRLNGVLFHGP